MTVFQQQEKKSGICKNVQKVVRYDNKVVRNIKKFVRNFKKVAQLKKFNILLRSFDSFIVLFFLRCAVSTPLQFTPKMTSKRYSVYAAKVFW